MNEAPSTPEIRPHHRFSIIDLAHIVVFFVLLSYWTYMLLRADPVPEAIFEGVSWFDAAMLKFILAKILHLCSYAFMAVLGGSLVDRWSSRRWILGLLILHGALTEIGQWYGNTYYNTNRHGCIRDVIIDTTGVLLGALALHLYRRIYRPQGT